MTVTLWDREFEMSTTLRVAYLVQGQHNHKPYMEIFKKIDELTIEDQIGILYASFTCANKDFVMTQNITRNVFTSYYLDNFTVGDVLNQLKVILGDILDLDEDELNGKKEEESTNNKDPELVENSQDLILEPGMTYSELDINVV